MSTSPLPIETAEATADFLRKEISARVERLRGIEDRKGRINERHQGLRDATQDQAQIQRIVNDWKEAIERNRREKDIAEAEMFAFRRTLQFLTGELW